MVEIIVDGDKFDYSHATSHEETLFVRQNLYTEGYPRVLGRIVGTKGGETGAVVEWHHFIGEVEIELAEGKRFVVSRVYLNDGDDELRMEEVGSAVILTVNVKEERQHKTGMVCPVDDRKLIFDSIIRHFSSAVKKSSESGRARNTEVARAKSAPQEHPRLATTKQRRNKRSAPAHLGFAHHTDVSMRRRAGGLRWTGTMQFN